MAVLTPPRDDRISQMQDKIEDYLSFGVRYGAFEASDLRTENPHILIPLEVVFS